MGPPRTRHVLGAASKARTQTPSIPAAMLCASSPLPAVPPPPCRVPRTAPPALVPPELCFFAGGLGIAVLGLPFACSQSPSSTLSIPVGPSADPGLSPFGSHLARSPPWEPAQSRPVCLAGVLKPKPHQIPPNPSTQDERDGHPDARSPSCTGCKSLRSPLRWDLGDTGPHRGGSAPSCPVPSAGWDVPHPRRAPEGSSSSARASG